MASLETPLTLVNNKTTKSELASTPTVPVAWRGVAPAPDALKVLLERLVKQAGNQRAAADVLKLSTGRLGKVRKGDGALTPRRLGLLAEALGVPLLDVLRAAGKVKDAEIFAKFATLQPLSDAQREWLTVYSTLTEGQRRAVIEIVRLMVENLGGSENPGSTRVRATRTKAKRRAS